MRTIPKRAKCQRRPHSGRPSQIHNSSSPRDRGGSFGRRARLRERWLIEPRAGYIFLIRRDPIVRHQRHQSRVGGVELRVVLADEPPSPCKTTPAS
jgi:hypothetical protein